MLQFNGFFRKSTPVMTVVRTPEEQARHDAYHDSQAWGR